MSSSGDLRARLIGSFYFVPLLAAMIFGYPLSALAGCIAIGWVAYEAVSILTGGRTGWSQRLFWLVIVLAFGIVFLPVSSVWMALIGAGFWAAAILLNNRREPAFVSLMVFASASLGAMLAKENGHLVLICLAAVISAGDVGAYISGRVLGGPKLALRSALQKHGQGRLVVCSVLFWWSPGCLFCLARMYQPFRAGDLRFWFVCWHNQAICLNLD